MTAQDAARLVAGMYRCPDCNAAKTVTETEGVVVLEVRHDETCPFYRAKTA